jgi:hypothetical protein
MSVYGLGTSAMGGNVRDWVSNEEGRRLLEDLRRGLVESEREPETSLDSLERGDTVTGEVVVVGSGLLLLL